jgi:hypothetical protein
MVVADVIALIFFLFRKKAKAVNPTALNVYKDLYVEAHAAKEKAHKELNLFRELFAESKVDPEFKEAEMAAVLNNLKNPTN